MTKAVGIILMVLAHARFLEYGNLWINMFHMPLFFFMSGYCFKEKYFDDFKGYSLKRIKGIYWPYVKWVLLFVLIHNLFYSIGIYTDNRAYLGAKGGAVELYQISQAPMILIDILLMNQCEQLLGGFWFLKSLLYASFIGYFLIKIFRKSVAMGGGDSSTSCYFDKLFSHQYPNNKCWCQ